MGRSDATNRPSSSTRGTLPLRQLASQGAPQIRVRSIELEPARLAPERVPAACWTAQGLCARPTLARLGRRIVLVAPEKSDLRALESPDEGESWSPVPVL